MPEAPWINAYVKEVCDKQRKTDLTFTLQAVASLAGMIDRSLNECGHFGIVTMFYADQIASISEALADGNYDLTTGLIADLFDDRVQEC